MKIAPERSGAAGWFLLAVFVWAWDALMPETLSSALTRGITNPRSRPFVLFAWAWVSSHLIFRKPQKLLIRW